VFELGDGTTATVEQQLETGTLKGKVSLRRDDRSQLHQRDGKKIVAGRLLLRFTQLNTQ
jgi:hypothetical protein